MTEKNRYNGNSSLVKYGYVNISTAGTVYIAYISIKFLWPIPMANEKETDIRISIMVV
jgi:predicted transcriptional regulator with HTH domain